MVVLFGTAGTAAADGEPVLYANKWTVARGERFALRLKKCRQAAGLEALPLSGGLFSSFQMWYSEYRLLRRYTDCC